MKRETPADVIVTRWFLWPPTGKMEFQSINSCTDHQARTITELGKLGPETPEVSPADPSRHGCKGCLEDWSL
jgi:hypothetical protein